MVQRFMIFAILFLSAAAAAVAAPANPVDGHWQGTVSGPNGDFTINFTFKADGTKLTGNSRNAQRGATHQRREDRRRQAFVQDAIPGQHHRARGDGLRRYDPAESHRTVGRDGYDPEARRREEELEVLAQ